MRVGGGGGRELTVVVGREGGKCTITGLVWYWATDSHTTGVGTGEVRVIRVRCERLTGWKKSSKLKSRRRFVAGLEWNDCLNWSQVPVVG